MGSKFTAGVLGAWDGELFYIEHIVRGRWEAAERETVIEQTAAADAQTYGRYGVDIWMEQEPGSGGKESAQNTVRRLKGYRVHAELASGDKFDRADPLAAQQNAGRCRIVAGEWNRAFLDEMEAARPGALYLDQMDAAAGAFNKLVLKRARSTTAVPPALMRGRP
jgi:predicted phage terminase large subunit-like protein